MQDKFGRKIDYLRISLIDRCNLRCIYCMPEDGVQMMSHDEILRIEEIETIARVATRIGIRSVRERVETMCAGTLRVESAVGAGTRVTIRIPDGEAET